MNETIIEIEQLHSTEIEAEGVCPCGGGMCSCCNSNIIIEQQQ